MAKKPAGKSKARGKAKSKAAPRGPQTLKQRAGQKIREHFSDLADSQAYVQLFGATGLTLEEQLMADLKMRDDGDSSITFGKLYYAEKKNHYAARDSIFVSLTAGPGDTSEVDPQLCKVVFLLLCLLLFVAAVSAAFCCCFSAAFLLLFCCFLLLLFLLLLCFLKAMEALKSDRRPDRGPMIGYLQVARRASRKDCSGVLRFLSQLRLTDSEIQLPIADKVLAWIVRCFLK